MNNRIRTTPLLVTAIAVLAAAWPASAYAASAPRLGTALNYAVMGGSTITNTGPTVVTGNLALSPGTSVTGFPPGSVTGTQDVADAAAVQAQNDLTTAYNDAANAPTTGDMSGQDLGNHTLTPGVYAFSASAQLTGPLTLSGNGVFIFKIGSTLTTASNATVLLTGGAQACAVYWQVGSSATLGSGTQFQGNLMALTSITMNTSANILTGRALARNGALTMDTNQVTPPTGTCGVAASSSTPAPTSTSTPTTVPNTGSGFPIALLPGIALLAGGAWLTGKGKRTRA